jgi:hypothetical protein
MGMTPFGMSEITADGLIMAGVGMLFLLTAGHWLLPRWGNFLWTTCREI